ncbi:MAG: glycosyltransferase family 4 protein [Clostridia bacterium]|nr:glycosyltransferase family 4 protein [Clostridia bacterium]
MSKKIACFFPTVSGHKFLGGSERRMSRVLSRLTEDDFDVSIVIKTSAGNSDVVVGLYKNFCNEKVKLVTVKSNMGIVRHFAKNKYDWVLYPDCCFRAVPVIFGSFFARSKRMILNVNSGADILYSNSFLRKAGYNFAVKASHRVDCLYPWIFDDFKTRYSKKTITLTPCSFTDFNKFFAAPEKEKNIIFSGRLVPLKNSDLFVDAMIKIKEQLDGKGYKCLLCGDGDPVIRNSLEDKIKHDKCEDIIKLIGYADMAEILPYSRIYCSLQKISNYPSQALIEAIACGNYCIATQHQNDDLLIRPEFATFIEESADSLAEAVLNAIEFSDEKWEQISKDAHEYALKNCHIDNQVNHYRNLLS